MKLLFYHNHIWIIRGLLCGNRHGYRSKSPPLNHSMFISWQWIWIQLRSDVLQFTAISHTVHSRIPSTMVEMPTLSNRTGKHIIYTSTITKTNLCKKNVQENDAKYSIFISSERTWHSRSSNYIKVVWLTASFWIMLNKVLLNYLNNSNICTISNFNYPHLYQANIVNLTCSLFLTFSNEALFLFSRP